MPETRHVSCVRGGRPAHEVSTTCPEKLYSLWGNLLLLLDCMSRALQKHEQMHGFTSFDSVRAESFMGQVGHIGDM